MITFRMIMTHVTSYGIAQGCLTHENHPVQRFLLDGTYKPFTMSVQIRTLWRQDDWFYPIIPQVLIEGRCEFAVAIMDQIPLVGVDNLTRPCTASAHHGILVLSRRLLWGGVRSADPVIV